MVSYYNGFQDYLKIPGEHFCFVLFFYTTINSEAGLRTYYVVNISVIKRSYRRTINYAGQALQPASYYMQEITRTLQLKC